MGSRGSDADDFDDQIVDHQIGIAQHDDDEDDSSYEMEFDMEAAFYSDADFDSDDDDEGIFYSDNSSADEDSSASDYMVNDYDYHHPHPLHPSKPAKNSVLETAEDLFGKIYKPTKAGDPNDITTDEENSDRFLIANFLTNLEFSELNESNPSCGGNLLLLAAKYDRSTKDSSEGKGSIIRWLLGNPDFTLAYVPDIEGNNALHLAMYSLFAFTDIDDCSDYRYTFKRHWQHVTVIGSDGLLAAESVALNAVKILTSDSNVCRLMINAPNHRGHTPLVRAMEASCKRAVQRKKTSKKSKDVKLCNECVEAIFILIESGYLRLQGMFDMSFVNAFLKWPRRKSVEGSTRLLAKSIVWNDTPSSLAVLSSYCNPFIIENLNTCIAWSPLESSQFGHARVLEALLSNNSGGMCDRQKALVLVTCLSFDGTWMFQPCEENTGAILRKLFVRYAKPCVRALYVLQNEIIRRTKTLLLLDSRPAVLNVDDTWGEILQFANWKNHVTDEWLQLRDLSRDLSDQQGEFFLGGIRSCFQRKYGIEEEAWLLIMEFSGWHRILPSIDLIPEVNTKNRKQW